MMLVVKNILGSKYFRLAFSGLLLYFAFRRVDVLLLLRQMSTVPWWFVILSILYMVIAMAIGTWRWCLLLISRPKFKDFLFFFKAAYLGAFYSLFIPSTVGGDLFKWLPLIKKYPKLSKIKIASSVLIDRIIGFTAFVLMATIAVLIGKYLGFMFPDFLVWLFVGLGVGVICFYVITFTTDFERVFERFRFASKLLEVVDLLKKENKQRMLVCFGISLLAEPIWLLPIWLYSLVFNVGMSLLSVYVFMPVISLILILPISVAGFGAREQLFLYFFSQLGIPSDKILLVSTFNGVITVVNNLLGFVLTLF